MKWIYVHLTSEARQHSWAVIHMGFKQRLEKRVKTCAPTTDPFPSALRLPVIIKSFLSSLLPDEVLCLNFLLP